MPCLMPLYGKGLRRPSILRLAVLINDLLSLHRNQGAQEEKHIAQGRILSRDETLKLAPGIRAEGLKGGVVWHDALLPESPILIKEILRWCIGQGAMALNYTDARSLTLRDGRQRPRRPPDAKPDDASLDHAAAEHCRLGRIIPSGPRRLDP
jgi:glycerol-3-phosphate dehydrogenase